jgi:hypothetical protein
MFWFLKLLASITQWTKDKYKSELPHAAVLAVAAVMKRHCALNRSLMHYENVQKINVENRQFFMNELKSLVENPHNLRQWVEFIRKDLGGLGGEPILPTPIHFILLSVAISKVRQFLPSDTKRPWANRNRSNH